MQSEAVRIILNTICSVYRLIKAPHAALTNHQRADSMAKNPKQTSSKIASVAGQTLNDPNASKLQKRLAASALAQRVASSHTSETMETVAAKALDNPRSSEKTKQLAATVLAQSTK